jgi:hypothetical protein
MSTAPLEIGVFELTNLRVLDFWVRLLPNGGKGKTATHQESNLQCILLQEEKGLIVETL